MLTHQRLVQTLFGAAILAVLTMAVPSDGFGQANAMTAPPAENFKKVSTLVELPDFIPGLGTLYVGSGHASRRPIPGL
jgi:hypothetical protein